MRVWYAKYSENNPAPKVQYNASVYGKNPEGITPKSSKTCIIPYNKKAIPKPDSARPHCDRSYLGFFCSSVYSVTDSVAVAVATIALMTEE
mmetsp:Transcript_24644/g.53164  ORF Transcript_24644/g.53164 Transcript_24644/m.53164 type:complete len:91 (-) Transcript_24644:766-1038(-)